MKNVKALLHTDRQLPRQFLVAPPPEPCLGRCHTRRTVIFLTICQCLRKVMLSIFDNVLPLALYVFFFCLVWAFRMDIQNASKAIWNACGNLKGRASHPKLVKRHASDSEVQLLRTEDESPSAVPIPDGKDSWSLVDSHRPDFGSASDLIGGNDCGRFTEDEFLARFGGIDVLLCFSYCHRSTAISCSPFSANEIKQDFYCVHCVHFLIDYIGGFKTGSGVLHAPHI